MSSLFNTLLTIHISSGVISLVLFWLPAFTAKGKKAHRRIGVAYVYAMGIVVGTAFILCIMRISYGDLGDGLALLFLSALTLLPLVSGVQVLKAKKPTPQYRYIRIVLAVLLLSTSIACFIGWYLINSTVLLVFGIIGVLASMGDLRRFIPKEGIDKSWLRQHYEAMIFSGVAAYTAFFAFGGRTLFGSLLAGWWGIVPWILPTLLAFLILPYINRHYGQQKVA